LQLQKDIDLKAIGTDATLGNFSGSARPDAFITDVGGFSPAFFKNYSQPGSVVIDSAFNVVTDRDAVAGADFDGDGKTDMLVSEYNPSFIHYLNNTMGEPVDFKICTDNTTGIAMTSDITGASYQWQQNDGTGFKPVTESPQLKDAATNTLHFFNTPLGW